MTGKLEGKIAVITGGSAGIPASDDSSYITGIELFVDGGVARY
jgi:hypothetical protein